MVSLLKRIFRRRVVVEFRPLDFRSETGDVYMTGLVMYVNGKEIGFVGDNIESAVFGVLDELGYEVEIKNT